MSRIVISAALVASALFAQRAAADNCSPSRVMVVLDKSSSMQTGMINGVTKWDIAVKGLGKLLDTYQTTAEFGLMTFPNPNQCGAGMVDVAPALNSKVAILSTLNTPPPTGGNYTPIAQTLSAAADVADLQAAPGTRHVILITDGWQYCIPYDPATRYDGTAAVAALNARGIKTWIVGFGAEVDADALNRMAVKAGTTRTSCNPAATDPAATDLCYYQVNNDAELLSALTKIAGTVVGGEECDGVDNNCDGRIDEDLSRSCSSACGNGTQTCKAGTWGECVAPQSRAEVCDGEDNDCDGEIDDGVVCDNPDNGISAGCCDAGATNPGAFALSAMLGLLLLRRRRR